METVGAYDAKTHLPKLLERVMKGERITITKNGVTVAMLQPPASGITADTRSVIAEILIIDAEEKCEWIFWMN